MHQHPGPWLSHHTFLYFCCTLQQSIIWLSNANAPLAAYGIEEQVHKMLTARQAANFTFRPNFSQAEIKRFGC